MRWHLLPTEQGTVCLQGLTLIYARFGHEGHVGTTVKAAHNNFNGLMDNPGAQYGTR